MLSVEALTPGGGMRIGWLVQKLDVNIASVRYRCLHPAAELRKSGWSSEFFDSTEHLMARLADFDCIVISKMRSPKAVDLARAASKLRKIVVLDLCDDITVRGYDAGRGWQNEAVIKEVAAVAAAVVTTGPILANRLSTIVPKSVPIHIVADQAETLGDIAAAEAMTRPSVSVSPNPRRSLLTAVRVRYYLRVAIAVANMFVRDPGGFAQRVRRKLTKQFKESRPEAKLAELGDSGRKRVIWFGNHGASHSNFGMASLLTIARELAEVNKVIPLELLVVSNSQEHFLRYIAPLPFPTRYESWNLKRCYDLICGSDVFVMPNFSDDFSIAKSANRVTLSLLLGTPVVARYIPSLEPLKDVIVTDAWVSGLMRYLGNPGAGQADVARAKLILDSMYSAGAIGALWRSVIEAAKVISTSPSKNFLFLVDLLQDFQVLMPVIREMVEHVGVHNVSVAMDEELPKANPWALVSLAELEIVPTLYRRTDLLRGDPLESLALHNALITAAESSLGPHRIAHALVKRAKALGISTFTLQHGYECPGITYFDDTHDASVEIASDHIFIWGNTESLPPTIPSQTRAKCIAVGRPTEKARNSNIRRRPARGLRVGIFENLHWHRYDDAYRAEFLRTLLALDCLGKSEGIEFILKPHPAGQWSTKNREKFQEIGSSVRILGEVGSPAADDLISSVDVVITTPSTLALDAAQRGLPVAVFAHSLEIRAYAPLEVIREAEDGVEFVRKALRDSSPYIELSRRFVANALAFENGLDNVIAKLLAEG